MGRLSSKAFRKKTASSADNNPTMSHVNFREINHFLKGSFSTSFVGSIALGPGSAKHTYTVYNKSNKVNHVH